MLELATAEPEPIRVEAGFVLIGDKYPIALNPEAVVRMECRPLGGTSTNGVQVLIWMTDTDQPCNDDPPFFHVVRFEDLLRAMESAIQWRRTWPRE